MNVDVEKIGEKRIEELSNLYNLTNKDELEYIFRGNFTPEVVRLILDLAKVTLENLSDLFKIKKKVYYIAGESIQNIARHHNEAFDESPDKFSLFAIHKKKSKFYVTTGNVIKSVDIASLKIKIEKINSLEKTALRSLSRSTRSSGEISAKGGAGLGLIEIAKRSGNSLEYEFDKINDEYSYFYLNTEIPIVKKEDIEKSETYSIVDVKELHDILINKNVILFFKSTFKK